MGPFRVIEAIGEQAYRLALPDGWKIHPVFHVSLSRAWKVADVQEDQPISQDDVPEVEEPYWEIERFCGGEKLKEIKRYKKSTWYCGRDSQYLKQVGCSKINSFGQSYSKISFKMTSQ